MLIACDSTICNILSWQILEQFSCIELEGEFCFDLTGKLLGNGKQNFSSLCKVNVRLLRCAIEHFCLYHSELF